LFQKNSYNPVHGIAQHEKYDILHGGVQ